MTRKTNLSSVLPAIFVILTLCGPAGGFSGTGSGTETDPYVITNVNELQQMQNDLTACYVLGNDIDASETQTWNGGAGFIPVGAFTGNAADSFTGTFDGAGHPIEGLYINRINSSWQGLFGFIWGATIQDVNLIDAEVTAYQKSGTLIGEATAESIITYCSATGTLTLKSGTADSKSGGLVGFVRNGSRIDRCFSGVNVNGDSRRQVGGLAGYIRGSGYSIVARLANSYSYGTVTGSGSEQGNLLGEADSCVVDRCYSCGYGKALIGFNWESPVITNCYWDSDKGASSSPYGGTPKTTMKMMQQATFVNWDFVDIWDIVEGQTYPFFGEPAVDANGLVAHWKLDESSGTIAYDSAGYNDGTVYGAQWTTGQIDGALDFDGDSDYVELGIIAGTDDLALAGSNFTICSWIKPNLTGDSYQRIVDKSTPGDGANGYAFIITTNGKIGVFVDRSDFTSDGSVITAGIWQHVTVTSDGSDYQLYVDGLPVSGSFVVGSYKSPPGVSTNMRIGTWAHFTDREFNGSIDDVRIYNKALTAEEIGQLCQEGLGELVGLEIVGQDIVGEDSSLRYKAIAQYESGSSIDVSSSATWWVEPDTYASIDTAGLLSTAEVDDDQDITIFAEYTMNDITVNAEKIVTVVDGLVPIAHWKLDEVEGDIAHDSAGSNDGTLVNGPVWTTGQVDGALDFDGADDYVAIQNLYYDSQGEIDEITVCAWVKSTSSNRQIIASFDRSEYWRLSLEDDAGPRNVGWDTADSGRATNDLGTSAGYADGNWHHICGWFKAGASPDKKIFVDGNLVASTTAHGGRRLGTGTKRYGFIAVGSEASSFDGSTGPDYFFNGAIDDVRIYDKALSTEEIEELYLSGRGTLIDLQIVGPDEVAENFHAQYKAIGHYDNNSTMDITNFVDWAVDPNNLASMSVGLLTTQGINMPEEDITIFAECTQGSNTVDAQKDVSIFAVCPYGTALEFDGQNDYVACGNLGAFPSSGTIEFWMKPEQISNYRNPFTTNFAGGNAGIRFEESNPGRFVVVIAIGLSPGIHDYVSSGLQAETWYHVVLAWNSSSNNVKGYLNGEEKFNEIQTNWPTTLPDVQIGRGYSTSSDRSWKGLVDEAAIYDRVLSAEEIQANMYTKLTGEEDGLVGCWNFDEGAGQIAYDLSPYANNGRLGSTPNPDGSDPGWTDSVPPIGVCTRPQLIERNIFDVLDIKLRVSEEIQQAVAKEKATKHLLREWFKSRDYGDLTRNDIVRALVRTVRAIFDERLVKRFLNRSINNLEDALSSLGWEPQPEPEPNLVAHWKFDEGTGYIAYDSVGTNHGNIYGAAWTAGQINNALNFDGADDYVEVNDNTSLDIVDEITIAAWIKADTLRTGTSPYESDNLILSKWRHTTAQRSYWLGIRATKPLFTLTSDGSHITYLESSTVLEAGKWYHIAGTYDGSVMKMYLNEGLDVQKSRTGVIFVSTEPIYIGCYLPDVTEFVSWFDGLIDEVAIYDRALSAEEVQQLYQNGL